MKKEKMLLAFIIEYCSEILGNKGCNDVDDIAYNGWSIEERRQFVKEYHEWNGDSHEYNEDFLHLPDWAILDFLSDKLLKQ